MIEENKISKFILELIIRTKKKEISWQKSKLISKISAFDETVIDLVYTTFFQEKYFRIFKYRVKDYRDEYEWEWTERIKLELIDESEDTLYEFPYDYSLFDLYNSVREETSGIAEFIDKMLFELK